MCRFGKDTAAIEYLTTGKCDRMHIFSRAGLHNPLQAFMEVYETNVWQCGSGIGSGLPYASRTLCLMSSILPHILNVDLFVDIPCGDQQWAPILREKMPQVKYLGLDVMPGLIQRNRELFSNEKTEFMLAEMNAPGVFGKAKAKSRLWKDANVVAIHSRHVLEHTQHL
jgi:hypothetical protein